MPDAARDLADYMGEAMRRNYCGLVRPLWRDLPEGPEKDKWRGMGRNVAEAIERTGLKITLPEIEEPS